MSLAKIRRFLFAPSKFNKRIITTAFAIIGFSLPILYAYINGFPIPQVHDEFSYLLAADTYSHGRFTNPSPAAGESFEAPHILVRPTYMSKYPPMQGLFLAAGKILFGDPAFGIWLSCGFAAASFFWMMCAWTRPKWAVFGTALMVLFLGINYYWAQSFWGGMVAAGGGALFFGGFRRLLKRVSIASTLLMTLGGIILVNSRPFEGTVAMLPALFVLLLWFLRDKRNTFFLKISRIVLPGFLLSGIALSLMAYNNYQLTGHPMRFAYTEHQSQYFSTPLFIFQSPSESEHSGHYRLKKLYDFLCCSGPIRRLGDFGLPRIKALFPLYAFVYLLIFLPFSFFSPILGGFFFLAVPLILRNRWMMLLVSTIAFTMASMSFATYWDMLHYAAPLTCCFFLLIAQGFRFFFLSAKDKRERRLVIFLVTVLLSVSYSFQFFVTPINESVINEASVPNLDFGRPIKLDIPKKLAFLKPVIEKQVQNGQERYLAIVSYDKDYSVHDEIVYNAADLENSKLIWAFDLGQEKNKTLIDDYPGRKLLHVEISGSSVKIEQFIKTED